MPSFSIGSQDTRSTQPRGGPCHTSSSQESEMAEAPETQATTTTQQQHQRGAPFHFSPPTDEAAAPDAAATPAQNVKRSANAVAFAPTLPARASNGGKRQKLTPAREDTCCDCSAGSTCSRRSCVCVRADRPCRGCDPGAKCRNTVAEHNRKIRDVNIRRASGSRLLKALGGKPKPPLPLLPEPTAKADAGGSVEASGNQKAPAIPEARQASDEKSSGPTRCAATGGNAAAPPPGGGEAAQIAPPANPTQNSDGPTGGARQPPATTGSGRGQPVGQAATERGGTVTEGGEEETGGATNGRDDEEGDHVPDGTYRPQTFSEEELRAIDPMLQRPLSAADHKLMTLFGDTIHHNAGLHLSGGVDDDALMQRLHKRIASVRQVLYDLPEGRWAARFLRLQTALFRDARERRCNAEKALIFAPCILQRIKGKHKFADTKIIIQRRLDAWEAGRLCALVSENVDCAMESGWGTAGPRAKSDEAAGRRFESMVLDGRLRAALRRATDRDEGGLLNPTDSCTKTGAPVIDVLRGKFPAARVPRGDEFDQYPPVHEDDWDPYPVYCFEEDVAKAAGRLSGSGGPCGVTGRFLRNWLLRHEVAQSSPSGWTG